MLLWPLAIDCHWLVVSVYRRQREHLRAGLARRPPARVARDEGAGHAAAPRR
jgi:hypothetical protein